MWGVENVGGKKDKSCVLRQKDQQYLPSFLPFIHSIHSASQSRERETSFLYTSIPEHQPGLKRTSLYPIYVLLLSPLVASSFPSYHLLLPWPMQEADDDSLIMWISILLLLSAVVTVDLGQLTTALTLLLFYFPMHLKHELYKGMLMLILTTWSSLLLLLFF